MLDFDGLVYPNTNLLFSLGTPISRSIMRLSVSGFVALVLLLAAVEGSESFVLHGGGMANIHCPDGSTIQGQVAFNAVQNGNNSISGNWTLDSTGSPGPSSSSLSEGLFYGRNFYEPGFILEGETNDPEEQINLCDVPMFGPISLTGKCGERVSLALAFQSNDPIDMSSPFPADVI